MEVFHLDPVNLIVVVAGFIVAWFKFFRKSDQVASTVTLYGEWIRKHDKECDEQRRITSTILTEMKTANAHLATLTEGHEKRLDRLENAADRELSREARA
jgi:hypothetical protein